MIEDELGEILIAFALIWGTTLVVQPSNNPKQALLDSVHESGEVGVFIVHYVQYGWAIN